MGAWRGRARAEAGTKEVQGSSAGMDRWVTFSVASRDLQLVDLQVLPSNKF